MTEQSNNLALVLEIIARYPRQEQSLIMVLQEINRQCNYLPLEALKLVAHELGLPESRVFSVATFYKAFSLKPRGKTVVRVCLGTACHIRGGPNIVNEVSRILNIAPGKTTEDREYTLETVNCVGACAMAPLILIGEKYHGNVTTGSIKNLLKGGNAGEV